MHHLRLSLAAFLLGAWAIATAATSTEVADRFIDALQHGRYNDAVAMFSHEAGADSARAGLALQRVHDQLDGFSTLHHVARLPDGRSERVEVPGLGKRSVARRIAQVLYAATEKDGQDVYYEVDLTLGADPEVLSFRVYFPVTDEASKQRAMLRVDNILR